MTLHRYMLNRRLAACTPLRGAVLEIGNGRLRRGLATGATATLDLSSVRQPDVQGDALALPFRDGALDGVICCETLQYVPNHYLALHEIRRVLRWDGALVASFPCRLGPQPDERPYTLRWTYPMLLTELALCRFRVERVEKLWPPVTRRPDWTSGWFIQARAA